MQSLLLLLVVIHSLFLWRYFACRMQNKEDRDCLRYPGSHHSTKIFEFKKQKYNLKSLIPCNVSTTGS